ncbi:unnamed protein product [Pleuronectes platessa]|uniref:Uncharacterized protein n=1 Tax=Pleuronectes platessa TaxID=8262 RepID=A0A9N7W371_PLEPL|nr:unnamed protein product [Pleuronectes platessa]
MADGGSGGTRVVVLLVLLVWLREAACQSRARTCSDGPVIMLESGGFLKRSVSVCVCVQPHFKPGSVLSTLIIRPTAADRPTVETHDLKSVFTNKPNLNCVCAVRPTHNSHVLMRTVSHYVRSQS